MKKCVFLFFVLCMAASFAAADDEGIGLSAGLEFGIENISKPDDSEMNPYLTPMLIYENSFLDDALDVYAELDYTIGFTKVPNDDGDEVLPHSVYFDLMAGYNLKLGKMITLSFILENEFDELIISPQLEGSANLTGIFTPAVKFNLNFGLGDFFAKVGAPITYYDNKDANATAGLDFTAGWNSTFGLGIEAKLFTLVAPKDEAGYQGFKATVSFETGPVYVEVGTFIPRKTIDEDLTISINQGANFTIEFDYSLQKFTFYVNCAFSGIGSEDKPVISPAIGVKYSF